MRGEETMEQNVEEERWRSRRREGRVGGEEMEGQTCNKSLHIQNADGSDCGSDAPGGSSFLSLCAFISRRLFLPPRLIDGCVGGEFILKSAT